MNNYLAKMNIFILLSFFSFLSCSNNDNPSGDGASTAPTNLVATAVVVGTDATHPNGIAVITGLTSETAYTATLFNGTKKRGDKTFTTGIDIGTGILVRSTDDLMQKIADAASGSVLVLEPGDYLADNQIGAITLNKSITLRINTDFNK